MKRFLSLCMGVLLSFSLVSCSQKQDMSDEIQLDPKNPIMLTMFTYYNDKHLGIIKEQVEEFNKTIGAEKGIVVDIASANNVVQANKMLIDSANDVAGSMNFPDIFITYKGLISQLNGKKEVIDFNNYFTKEELALYNPKFIKAGIFENDSKVSMLPIGSSTYLTFVNETDFEKVKDKINATYDDLLTYEGIVDTAKKYYEYTDSLTPYVKNDGKPLYGVDSIVDHVFCMLESMDKPIMKKAEEGKELSFDEVGAKTLWDAYFVPVIKGYFGKYGKFVSEDLKTGSILVGTSSSTGSAYIMEKVMNSEQPERDIDIKILYSPKLNDYKSLPILQGGGIFITKSDEKREYASSMFVKYLTNKENNATFSVKASYIPVRTDNVDTDYIVGIGKENNISEVSIKSILTAVDELNNTEQFIAPDVKKFEDVRDEVRIIFSKDIYEARENLMQRYEQGEDYDDLINEYTGEEAFKIWYEDTKQRLENRYMY